MLRPAASRRVILLVCLLQSLPAQQPGCTSPPSGLVDWWPSDGNTKDISGPSDGTIQGGVTFALGKVGSAFTFDGTGSVTFGAAGNVGVADFTIDFWLNSSSATTQGVIGKRVGCTHNPFYDIRIMSAADFGGAYPGHLLVELDQGDGVNDDQILSSRAINDGVFHLVAVVRQGPTVSVYIDGTLDGVQSTSATIDPSNSGVLSAGISACNGAGPNVPLTGQLDEIEFFGRALTSSEIGMLFDAGSAGKCKPATLHVCLLYDSTKAAKSGSTLPIKLQLCDAVGNNLSSSTRMLHALGITQVSTSISGNVQDSGNSNPDNDFRFDSTLGNTGGYIFNLSTKGLATGTYDLNFTVNDDSLIYVAPFQVK